MYANWIAIDIVMCPFFEWPISCANTATSSSVLVCLISVSKSAIRLNLPNPVKKALECAERFEPSIE